MRTGTTVNVSYFQKGKLSRITQLDIFVWGEKDGKFWKLIKSSTRKEKKEKREERKGRKKATPKLKLSFKTFEKERVKQGEREKEREKVRKVKVSEEYRLNFECVQLMALSL